MVQGASFSTSAIRAYTGDTGPTGNSFIGATGPTGATGPAAPSTLAPTGATGNTADISLSTTIVDGEYRLVFTTSTGDSVTVQPLDRFGRSGLTGIDGPVTGTFGTYTNFLFGGGATVLANVLDGTINVVGADQYSVNGVSGSTLEFRKIDVAGDLVFYTDESQKIGTGATYHILGISGPVASDDVGTAEAQSIGEIATLRNPRSAIDAHGLTFTENTTTIPPGLASGGVTWGTLQTNMLLGSNHYDVSGSVSTGVLTDPFYLNNDKSNTHLIYAPFNLRGISFSAHGAKKPVSNVPAWVYESTGETGVTADHGEMHSSTLLISISNSPRDVQFSDRFYFDPGNNTLSSGMNIVNCLSFDEGYSWFCTVTGKYYRLDDTGDDVTLYGACCNAVSGSPLYLDCNEFVTKQECDERADSGYVFYENTPCSDTPCNIGGTIGSCCINKDSTGETTCLDTGNMPGGIVLTRELCEKYGGNFRPLTPCGSDFPCGNPCNEDFGERGACCEFDSNGEFVECYDDFGLEECIAKGETIDGYTSFNGEGTFCSTTDCCAGEARFGACCLPSGICQGSTTAKVCAELGGYYQGNDTQCANVVCSCDPTIPPGPSGDPPPPPPPPPGGALGACCGVDGSFCVENVYEEDCPANATHYEGLTCQLADCTLPPPPPPLGKCCKGPSTCSDCTDEFFDCNDSGSANSKWTTGNDENGIPFGGFPSCGCNDNGGLGISEFACKSLFGPDAIWTETGMNGGMGPLHPDERCTVTIVPGAPDYLSCGNYKDNIGKCCTGVVDPVTGCECFSCQSKAECAGRMYNDNGQCPPDSSYSCDLSGWIAYFNDNPGEFYTESSIANPSDPFSNNINCGGCDSPNDSADANCVACGGSSSGGGGPPSGGGGDDCGCGSDDPVGGCICWTKVDEILCDDGTLIDVYEISVFFCIPVDDVNNVCSSSGGEGGCIQFDGCRNTGTQGIINSIIDTYGWLADGSGRYTDGSCSTDIGSGGGPQP